MQQQLNEFSALNETMRMLKDKVGKLSAENTGLQDEVGNAQENLRLSAAQNQKIMMELNQYKDQLSHNDQEANMHKNKIQKLLQENSGLAEEVRNAQ